MAKTSFSTWFLYRTIPGRMILSILVRPGISRLAGRFLSSRLSKILIPFYVKACHLDLSLCDQTDFQSFNDCFTRHYREDVRPFDPDLSHPVCPCDGLLSAYPIRDGLVLPVKQSAYRIEDLVKDAALAHQYRDGLALVFRLEVTNYHRYFFIDEGRVLNTRAIPGLLHTVRPIALRDIPVFTENARDVTLMETEHFGKVTQIEVGAMMVGKIRNHPVSEFHRGEEKGCFLFGGSTVILLFEKDRIRIRPELTDATSRGHETPVKAGERLD
ncbi:MAG: phosphatidylserine decarboxylase [Firmicutes bacterium]|nr:phosphatidylserine decarboxylase [Bacillota bacterium]